MSKLNFVDEYVTPFIKEDLVPFVINLAIAVALLWIGHIVIRKMAKLVSARMEKTNLDPTLRPFLVTILNTLLKVILYITVIGVLGIPTTSLAAILAAAGIAIGMALSGTLQNFAGGVMLLVFKPFKVGDVIEAQGYTGKVKEVSLFVSILTTFDNKTIILPNGPLSNGAMVNYSTEEFRRVDWTFGIGYGDDTGKAREIIHNVIKSDARILSTPEVPFVEVVSLGDSSVNFAVRVWVKQGDYWGVFFKMNESIYQEFNANGINIPFPQMDVHLHQSK
jgi:small conductance mechanosensitive channel